MALLEIESLRVTFAGSERAAVDGVTIAVEEGTRVGIIGESGSGKSVTAMSVLRLNDEKSMRYGPGSQIRYSGDDVLRADKARLARLRGGEISMIFQDPMSVLNPVFRVGRQILDVLRTHTRVSRDQAHERVIASLARVGIHDPERVFRQYPHELSGGMRQRVMIAMAIAARPHLLIADEPTSALDVTVQSAVLDTLGELVDSLGMSALMITHDMGVVARFCDLVYVMRGGVVVEHGPVAQVLTAPSHDYTRRLLRAVPSAHRAP